MAKNVVSLLMGKLKNKITIKEISKLLKMEPGNCRTVIARVRKIRPVYAEQDGSGYKFATKEQIAKLIKFEEKTIKNHMANLEVLKRYA